MAVRCPKMQEFVQVVSHARRMTEAAGVLKMTIILRDKLTGLYYSATQTWCGEVVEAMVFDSLEEAAVMAHDRKLASVEVVLHYEEPRCDLALPITACLPDARGSGTTGQNPRKVI